MADVTLVQFRSSHYNEKARWALDYKGVPHVRRTVLPGFHARAVRKLTGKTQVPVLLEDGEVIEDSTRIIAALEQSHPEPPLYPSDAAQRERALALEDFFDEQVGPFVRHAMFCLSIEFTRFIASLFAGHKGPVFRSAYATALGMRREQLRRAMRLTPEGLEESRARIEAGFERLEAEVQTSGYLVGSEFSVADLTAASLCSILIFPDEFPHPPVSPRPPPVVAFQQAFRDRPGGQWVREMYRRHRGTSAAVSE